MYTTTKPAGKPARGLMVAVVVLAGAAGCTTYTDFEAFIQEPRPLVTSTEYRVAPPDVIRITSKRVREINGHSEQIRPDGKITLPLLGTVFVAGRTVEEIAAELTQMAAEYYDDAEVSVRVTGFNSKKIYVFGEVGGAGPLSYTGTNTVLRTLARAQPTRLADPNKIIVLRPNPDGQLVRKMTVSLDRMVKNGDTSLDAVLEEGDIIYVPPNALASIGLGLQQLLLPIQPAASVVSGPESIDSSLQASPYREPAEGN